MIRPFETMLKIWKDAEKCMNGSECIEAGFFCCSISSLSLKRIYAHDSLYLPCRDLVDSLSLPTRLLCFSFHLLLAGQFCEYSFDFLFDKIFSRGGCSMAKVNMFSFRMVERVRILGVVAGEAGRAQLLPETDIKQYGTYAASLI